jgi:hypothetical protein
MNGRGVARAAEGTFQAEVDLKRSAMKLEV